MLCIFDLYIASERERKRARERAPERSVREKKRKQKYGLIKHKSFRVIRCSTSRNIESSRVKARLLSLQVILVNTGCLLFVVALLTNTRKQESLTWLNRARPGEETTTD